MTPNPPQIRVDQLREGDVLLSYGVGGKGSSSYFCRLFDGGAYSHAAYWTGRTVIEAVDEGVREIEMSQHLEEHEYVHAYRFKADGGGFDASLITKRARACLGAKYATARLATIGVLVGLGRASRVPAFQEFLASDLRHALAKEVAGIKASGLPAMICSQLVATAFYEATADRAYGLETTYDPSPLARFLSDDESPDLEELRRQCVENLSLDARDEDSVSRPVTLPAPAAPSAARPDKERFLGADSVRVKFGKSVKLTRVTPRDIQRSCSLEIVGCVIP